MQCALVAMLAAGYRPSANEPSHHQTMIQSLPLILGVTNDAWVVLDAPRRQRNAADYTGQPITAASVAECMSKPRMLEKTLVAHLRDSRPTSWELMHEPRRPRQASATNWWWSHSRWSLRRWISRISS